MLRRQFIKNLSFSLAGITVPCIAAYKAHSKYFKIYEGKIAGYQYHDGEQIANKINNGTILKLKREPNNRYDSRAIAVHCKDKKIGYIAMADNMPLAALMDNGCQLRAICKAHNTEAETWERVAFQVEMKKE